METLPATRISPFRTIPQSSRLADGNGSMGKGGTSVNVYFLSRGIKRLRMERHGAREESVAKLTTYVNFCISSAGREARKTVGHFKWQMAKFKWQMGGKFS
jgi:hypothetical protein